MLTYLTPLSFIMFFDNTIIIKFTFDIDNSQYYLINSKANECFYFCDQGQT